MTPTTENSAADTVAATGAPRTWSPPTLSRRIGGWLNRAPQAIAAATLVSIAWTLLVYGLPYAESTFAVAFLSLLAGPVIASTLVLPHARRRWWRAAAVPIVIFSAAPASMVPITIAALAWYGYRTFHADAPWAPVPHEQENLR